MEIDLLSVALNSRKGFDKIQKFTDIKSYSREFQHLLKFIDEYYSTDKGSDKVDYELLLEGIKTKTENDKHVDRFKDLLERAVLHETSLPNVEAVILAARRRELEISLALAFSDGNKKTISSLMEEYDELKEAESLDDLEESEHEILIDPDVEDLLKSRDKDNIIPLFPRVLNDRVDGGVERGDNVFLFGSTEIGKSLLAIHNACCWARSGLRVLYLINEDKISRIAIRMVSNLTGLTRQEIERDPREANQVARARGFGNIILVQIIPGNPDQIDRLIEIHSPDVVVVDQIRNINTTTKGNKVAQMEEAATAMRNVGKKRNTMMFNITQAGESARNKVFLDTGDIDFSNVGMPGQADLMIGFGADNTMQENNERGISLCKNKISGDHAKFVLRINPFLSRAIGI